MYEEFYALQNVCFVSRTSTREPTPPRYDDGRLVYDYDFNTTDETSKSKLPRFTRTGRGEGVVLHHRDKHNREHGAYFLYRADVTSHADATSHAAVNYTGVALIPTVSTAQGFYNLFGHYVPTVFGLLKRAKDEGILTGNESNISLLYPSNATVNSTYFKPMFTAFGITNIRLLSEISSQCFSKVIFGRQRYYTSDGEIKRHLSAAFGHDDSRCAPDLVVIVHRRMRYRTLLNAEQLQDYIKSFGFNNVELVALEHLSFDEQVRIVTCTRVFIAVHGAALAWFVMLPRRAVVIEITYENWPSRYAARARFQRPDVVTYVVKCQGRTSDQAYLAFARRHFSYSGPVTQTLKDKVVRASDVMLRRDFYPFGLSESIYKMTDCFCEPSVFHDILVDLTGKYSKG